MTMTSTIHISDWPLWHLTYRIGRRVETTEFWSANQATANEYAQSWVDDFNDHLPLRTASVESVDKAV